MRALCADVLDGAEPQFTFANPVFHSDETRMVFDRAFAHAGGTTDAGGAVACESDLLTLIARLRVHSTGRRIGRLGTTGSISRAKARIDANPSAPVTLSELADEQGLSRYQLLRAFSRETGLPPHAYIVQRRIELARRLIRTGHAIAEAAVLAGFYDQSHFTRCFVRQFGIGPRQYVSASSMAHRGGSGH
jgi:AraC-type DNA-binding domain-containing proteins